MAGSCATIFLETCEAAAPLIGTSVCVFTAIGTGAGFGIGKTTVAVAIGGGIGLGTGIAIPCLLAAVFAYYSQPSHQQAQAAPGSAV